MQKWYTDRPDLWDYTEFVFVVILDHQDDWRETDQSQMTCGK